MAARNVLVDHNKLCKIADFGMSRNVRDTGQIYEQRQSKVLYTLYLYLRATGSIMREWNN